MGTYGVTRPRKTNKVIVIAKKKKAEPTKGEVVTKAVTKKKNISKKTAVKKK